MDGESQRSRSGPPMFSQFNANSPFSKLRFDVESLGGGGSAPSDGSGLRVGLPGDPRLDDALRYVPMPSGFTSRLHRLVDELADDATA